MYNGYDTLSENNHIVDNPHMQNIEKNNVTLRTRFKRLNKKRIAAQNQRTCMIKSLDIKLTRVLPVKHKQLIEYITIALVSTMTYCIFLNCICLLTRKGLHINGSYNNYSVKSGYIMLSIIY
ncbi:IS1 family transposase [Candidatus Enterovibrio altilux]|uniref:IS1 family transposase n=1 Tax=Candidatus Enterovibrio altilux TaxID=1927128 RepID=UPI000BBC3CF5